MVNFPSQINNLVLLLIAIQVVHNEAAKITSQTKLLSNGSSKAVTKSQEVNDAKLPINSEEGSNASGEGEVSFSTDIAERHSNARDSTQYSYFYVASWVWHIPLWFTLWFTFYVLFNVFRAIYGHHVIKIIKFPARLSLTSANSLFRSTQTTT